MMAFAGQNDYLVAMHSDVADGLETARFFFSIYSLSHPRAACKQKHL